MLTRKTSSAIEATTKASPRSTPRSASPKENIRTKESATSPAPAPIEGWPSASGPNSASVIVQVQPVNPTASPCSTRKTIPVAPAAISKFERSDETLKARAHRPAAKSSAMTASVQRPYAKICRRAGASLEPFGKLPSQSKPKKPLSILYHGTRLNPASPMPSAIFNLRSLRSITPPALVHHRKLLALEICPERSGHIASGKSKFSWRLHQFPCPSDQAIPCVWQDRHRS